MWPRHWRSGTGYPGGNWHDPGAGHQYNALVRPVAQTGRTEPHGVTMSQQARSLRTEDPVAASPERVLVLATQAADIAAAKGRAITAITGRTRILALNAAIEAARSGPAGRGFGVVAGEVKAISAEIAQLASDMQSQLAIAFKDLRDVGARMVAETRGARLIDLARHVIEIIDRNLYERSCDVRWWATDSAVVAALTSPDEASLALAEQRLGVILSAYTVYLDLWVCRPDGRVVAHGRPERFARVKGTDVSGEGWFREALKSASGDTYTVADVAPCPGLNGQSVATYATAVREGGAVHGGVLGVLGIHFDWAPQASNVVGGVRLSEEDARRTRVLILDASHRVLAASDGKGLLTETMPMETDGAAAGSTRDPAGRILAFHRTPGYETYEGLGWYGAIVQEPAAAQ